LHDFFPDQEHRSTLDLVEDDGDMFGEGSQDERLNESGHSERSP